MSKQLLKKEERIEQFPEEVLEQQLLGWHNNVCVMYVWRTLTKTTPDQNPALNWFPDLNLFLKFYENENVGQLFCPIFVFERTLFKGANME